MKSLFVMGFEASGKTILTLGLSLCLMDKGVQVGYFKPVGTPSSSGPLTEDEGVKLLKEILGLPTKEKVLSPVSIGAHYLSSSQRKEKYQDLITSALTTVKKEQRPDVLLIGGATNPYILSSYGLDAVSLAQRFKAPVILSVNANSDFALDQSLFLNHYLQEKGVPVLGNVFNNVFRPLQDKVEGVYQPLFEEQGCKVLGIVPATSEINYPTAREYVGTLGGELLIGEDFLDKRIENIVVGSMTMEGALKYLQRSPNKAVVIGGDRNDLALCALETSTSLLILTGGLYPNIKVISQAEEKEVPVLLVHHDTYSTVELIHSINKGFRIHPHDKEMIGLVKKNIHSYCNWDALWDYLEIDGGVPEGVTDS